MNTLLVKYFGCLEYDAALSLQEHLVRAKRAEPRPDMLLLLEHPHVFTIGRGGRPENLLRDDGVPLYRTSRGGDITYHGPGQLIVYPILDLKSKLRRDVHLFLRKLERTTLETLQAFGVAATRRPPWTGIWIGGKKIASIGIAVRGGITFHGLSLNVQTDLRYFERIVPCGLPWAETTSMEKELRKKIAMEHVKDRFVESFMKRFGFTQRKDLCLEDIPIGSKSGFPEARTISA